MTSTSPTTAPRLKPFQAFIVRRDGPKKYLVAEIDKHTTDADMSKRRHKVSMWGTPPDFAQEGHFLRSDCLFIMVVESTTVLVFRVETLNWEPMSDVGGITSFVGPTAAIERFQTPTLELWQSAEGDILPSLSDVVDPMSQSFNLENLDEKGATDLFHYFYENHIKEKRPFEKYQQEFTPPPPPPTNPQDARSQRRDERLQDQMLKLSQLMESLGAEVITLQRDRDLDRRRIVVLEGRLKDLEENYVPDLSQELDVGDR